MIPFPVAPLAGVTVLVTRPQPQAQSLCEKIVAAGGDAVAFPAITIERLAVEPLQTDFDWVIFVSVHAVEFGLHAVRRSITTKFAAIGRATAAALAAAKVEVHALPDDGTTSEDLLRHPALTEVQGSEILIVKGRGGRDVLREHLAARGARLSTLEVYERRRPTVDAGVIQAIEDRWNDTGFTVVTLTSVETLDNLLAILGGSGRDRLRTTPFVTFSARIAEAARAHGLEGDCILARSADQDALVGAIAAWHARAR